MTEKYFAATPFTCRNTILVLHIIIQSAIENGIAASCKILLELKDVEGICVHVSSIQLQFPGLPVPDVWGSGVFFNPEGIRDR